MALKRINGLDLAVAILLPFVIYYGYHLGLGQNKEAFRRDQLHLVFDGGVAVFIFVNGLTSGLSMASVRRKKVRNYLFRKGLLLAVIGLLASFCKVPSIFMLLGLVSMASSQLVQLTSNLLRIFVGVLLGTSAWLYFLTDTKVDIAPLLRGADLHMIMHYAYTGYYAFLPWALFFIAGILHSRWILSRPSKSSKTGLVSGVVIILIGIGSETFFGNRFPMLGGEGSSPYPLMQPIQFLFPSFLITTFGTSLVVTHLAFRFNEFEQSKFLSAVHGFARMKYSVLAAAIAAGCLAELLLNHGSNFGHQTIALFTVMVCVITFVASIVWLRFFSNGPIEALLRVITPSR